MVSMFHAFVSDDSGATAIEYSLIAALVSVAIITIVSEVGQTISSVFGTINSTMQGKLNVPAP